MKKKTIFIIIFVALFIYASLSIAYTLKYESNNFKDNECVQVEYEYNSLEFDEDVREDEFFTSGYITTDNVNVVRDISDELNVLDKLMFNNTVEYSIHNSEWAKIKYNDEYGYVKLKYISNEHPSYTVYNAPQNSGFKSFMDYRTITSKESPQYKLQHTYAKTGLFGIRTVNGRYCIAVGSRFTTEIGQYFDLVLENGTVIPCVLADQKADKDTDSNNAITAHNGCMSEFIIDGSELTDAAKQYGDMSLCLKEWVGSIKEVRLYNVNVFDE